MILQGVQCLVLFPISSTLPYLPPCKGLRDHVTELPKKMINVTCEMKGKKQKCWGECPSVLLLCLPVLRNYIAVPGFTVDVLPTQPPQKSRSTRKPETGNKDNVKCRPPIPAPLSWSYTHHTVSNATTTP